MHATLKPCPHWWGPMYAMWAAPCVPLRVYALHAPPRVCTVCSALCTYCVLCSACAVCAPPRVCAACAAPCPPCTHCVRCPMYTLHAPPRACAAPPPPLVYTLFAPPCVSHVPAACTTPCVHAVCAAPRIRCMSILPAKLESPSRQTSVDPVRSHGESRPEFCCLRPFQVCLIVCEAFVGSLNTMSESVSGEPLAVPALSVEAAPPQAQTRARKRSPHGKRTPRQTEGLKETLDAICSKLALMEGIIQAQSRAIEKVDQVLQKVQQAQQKAMVTRDVPSAQSPRSQARSLHQQRLVAPGRLDTSSEDSLGVCSPHALQSEPRQDTILNLRHVKLDHGTEAAGTPTAASKAVSFAVAPSKATDRANSQYKFDEDSLILDAQSVSTVSDGQGEGGLQPPSPKARPRPPKKVRQILLPDAKWKQVWNFFWLLFCSAEFMFITLNIALSPMSERTAMAGGAWADPVAGWYIGYYTFATVFFGIDMVLGSRTAFVKDSGIMCDDDEKEILFHYLRSKFPLDALCTFPFSLIMLPIGAPAGYAFHAASWVRLLRPIRALKLLEWSNSLLEMPGHMFLQFMIFFVFIAAHTFVCGSIMFYRWFEPENAISSQMSVAGTYEVATYWLLTCLSTVGFGDISPTTVETRLFSLSIMLFAIVLNVYILSAGLSGALKRGVTEVSVSSVANNLPLPHSLLPLHLPCSHPCSLTRSLAPFFSASLARSLAFSTSLNNPRCIIIEYAPPWFVPQGLADPGHWATQTHAAHHQSIPPSFANHITRLLFLV